MITDREEFIKICGLLAHSDIQLEDCNYITNFIVELGKEIEQLKENNLAMQEEMCRTWEKLNIIKELRSWLEEEIDEYGNSDAWLLEIGVIKNVLSKLNELEGKNVKN